ncbi:MAG: hypothetical protein QXT69_05030 [Fervidicoccaceae archaeon]
MKSNPRNEGLYYILRETQEGKPWLDEVLESITDCEIEGNEIILIIDRKTGRGVKVVTRYDPSLLDSIPEEWKELHIFRADEDWTLLTEALGACRESRILRQKDIVLVECTSPNLSVEDAIKILSAIEDPEVLCYYGWAD